MAWIIGGIQAFSFYCFFQCILKTGWNFSLIPTVLFICCLSCLQMLRISYLALTYPELQCFCFHDKIGECSCFKAMGQQKSVSLKAAFLGFPINSSNCLNILLSFVNVCRLRLLMMYILQWDQENSSLCDCCYTPQKMGSSRAMYIGVRTSF